VTPFNEVRNKVSLSLTLIAEHTLRGSPVPSQHEQKKYCLVLFNSVLQRVPNL